MSYRGGRVAALGIAAVLGVAGISACTSEDTGAQDTAQRFLTDVAKGDVAGAAAQTNSSAQARAGLTQLRTELQPRSASVTSPTVTKNGSRGSATFTMTWQLGAGPGWQVPSTLDVAQNGGQWQVIWSPSILTPMLRVGQTLGRTVVEPTLPSVVGAGGQVLYEQTTVVSVAVSAKQAVDLNSVAQTLAGVLSQFDPTITAQSITAGATAAGTGGYTVVSLRDSDYLQVRSVIHDLPGVTFPSQTELLSTQRRFGAAMLPTMRTLAKAEDAANGGITIFVKNTDGSKGAMLFTADPATPAPITVTLDKATQQAAETALATVPQQAMAVVIQPSTGHVLAVAANTAAITAGDSPLTGRYPPGSTFKIVTATAALQGGTVTPATREPCPGTTTIENTVIHNEGNFDLGTVPLTTAFARSCNTTFSQIAAGLSPDTLPRTAKQFGIGVDYNMPGVPTNTGAIPTDQDVYARASDGFGQGKDVVSPFGMALAAATAANGSTPTPSLVAGPATTSDTKPAVVSAPVLSSLRQLMRAVVTSGTASPLAAVTPPVYGKTGTAQFGDATQSHGWFVGYQGDLAFAFLLVDAGSSAPAVTVAGTFLKAHTG
jgi:beta-lactamase class D